MDPDMNRENLASRIFCHRFQTNG